MEYFLVKSIGHDDDGDLRMAFFRRGEGSLSPGRRRLCPTGPSNRRIEGSTAHPSHW